MSAPEISVVLPCFNELSNLPELRRRLVAALEAAGRTFEVVFVDDGSGDGSFETMAAFAAEDPRIRAIRLSRNFGHQVALTAGLDATRGAAIEPGLAERFEREYQILAVTRSDRLVRVFNHGRAFVRMADSQPHPHFWFSMENCWCSVDILRYCAAARKEGDGIAFPNDNSCRSQ